LKFYSRATLDTELITELFSAKTAPIFWGLGWHISLPIESNKQTNKQSYSLLTYFQYFFEFHLWPVLLNSLLPAFGIVCLKL
jgi:hypothetical protein